MQDEFNGKRLPDDLYRGLVDALFQDRKSLIMGSAATSLAAIVVAVATRQPWTAAFVVAMPLVAAWRLRDFSAYGLLAKPLPTHVQRHWERRYVGGAALYLAVLGLWTLVTFYSVEDGFARILALMATTGHALGIATRNFTFRRGASIQLLAVGVPVVLASIFAGGLFPLLIPLVLAPLGLFILTSASRLRVTFLGEMIERRRAARLARQFDAALNNMPLGLCMLDRQGEVVVVNRSLLTMFGELANQVRPGANVRNVMAELVAQERISSEDASRVSAFLLASDKDPKPLSIQARSGRAIELTINRMDDGAVVIVHDVTERRESERIIERLARYDSVTGLPNRFQFEQRLRDNANIALTGRAAVFFIDLDDFKQVNDTLGHARGDELLRIVARRLREAEPAASLISRWGGDEFALLYANIDDQFDATHAASAIISRISKPCVIDGYRANVGAGIGIAYTTTADDNTTKVLKDADLALYAAKSEGRNCARLFQSQMHEQVVLRRALGLDVRAAIDECAIQAHYQPIVDARSHRIRSFEALARWRHPERGYVPPIQFVPLIEELGLIEPFTRSILKQACAACATWPDDLRVAVNLSAAHFVAGDVIGAVDEALSESGLAPQRLELELTEGLLLDDRPETLATITALRNCGVRIVLDDFGTGYSSLGYLLRFPIDKVKIDKSFVVGVECETRVRHLVESVALMIDSMGMAVTIEGIETAEQMSALAQCAAISEMQGYLFSRPVESDQIPALLLQFARRPSLPRLVDIDPPRLRQG